MPKDSLNEREFELINIVGAKLSANQRDLSRHMSLSLGTTNMLIRRLVNKGYLRITQLDKRKVRYMLTPKGFSEKMRKSVKYTVKTINSIGSIRTKIRAIIEKLYAEGERCFYILGATDLVTLVEMTFHQMPENNCEVIRVSREDTINNGGVVLVCLEKYDPSVLNGTKYINLIEELAKDETIFNGAE